MSLDSFNRLKTLISTPERAKLKEEIAQHENLKARLSPTSPDYTHESKSLNGWKKRLDEEMNTLDAKVVRAADAALESPLSMIELTPGRTYTRHLQDALACYDAVEMDEAEGACAEAEKSVTSDGKTHTNDRGIVLLFKAVMAMSSNPPHASKGVEMSSKAYRLFDVSDPLGAFHRFVARVIQGNAYQMAGMTERALDAYSDAQQEMSDLMGRIAARNQMTDVHQALDAALERRIQAATLSRPTAWGVGTTAIRDTGAGAAGPTSARRPGEITFKMPVYATLRAGPPDLPGLVPQEEVGSIVVRQIGGKDPNPECLLDGQPLRIQFLGKTTALNAGPTYVTIRVAGNSMNRAGIDPGDYVVVEKANFGIADADSGDIVAAAFFDYSDRATLKQIQIETDPQGRRTAVVFKPVSSSSVYKDRAFSLIDPDPDGPLFRVVCIARAVLKPMA